MTAEFTRMPVHAYAHCMSDLLESMNWSGANHASDSSSDEAGLIPLSRASIGLADGEGHDTKPSAERDARCDPA
jgi:hypothetical protein